jgi:protease-4
MKPIFRFFNILWHALDGLRKALHLLVLLLIFGVLLAALLPHVPLVPSKAVLVINPQGALVEQTTGGPLDRAVAQASGRQQTETLLRDVLDSIRFAKDDNRIQAILLDLGGMSGGGLSKLEEIAVVLKSFRESGKPVIAFGESYDQSNYYVAAHADEVYLDPHGMIFIDGFGYYRMFLKDAIDKLGVDVNVFRAGKFKSYTDQFSRNDMSETEREESTAWLNALWRNYQSTVTKARGLQPDALSVYVEQMVTAMRANGGDFAGVAAERNLVSELKTRRQVEQRLMAITGEDDSTHSFRSIELSDYVEAERPRHALAHVDGKKIAVVVASGEILDGVQPSGTVGGDSLASLLRDTRYDDDVSAVVLRIDSPGGSVFASEVIRREIEALKSAGKPVIASMSSTAASGGYYIAMNADEIWASPTTLTGSIGVFAVLPTLERTLAKVGVHTDGVGTTSLSGGFNLQRSLTNDQRELLQLSVEHEYRQFIGNVAAARSKKPEEIDAVAQGRVWAGSDAIEHGLVDHLGLMQDAVDAAAKRANLGTKYKLDYREPETSWRQAFANEIHVLAARAARAIAPEQVSLARVVARVPPLEAELKRLARFTDTRSAYYYCVCTVQ